MGTKKKTAKTRGAGEIEGPQGEGVSRIAEATRKAAGQRRRADGSDAGARRRIGRQEVQAEAEGGEAEKRSAHSTLPRRCSSRKASL